MPERALITGITGQDGSYLTELLLGKGYEVHGVVRKASSINTERIDHLYVDPHEASAGLFLHHADLSRMERLRELVYEVGPDEIYHLGSQSHVASSFELPVYTGDVTGLGTTRILEAIRQVGVPTRFYQASSSEMFGDAPAPQNEATAFRPQSPYAIAKVYAYWITLNYRRAYGLHASNGILFNHESPRRGETFVTRKITRAVARIAVGRQQKLYMGNLEARRDWGYAPDYVEAMWLMLQQEEPGEYVIGTGEAHTVRDFVEEAFSYVGLDWHDHVEIDQRYLRPAEVPFLMADPEKAHRELGWAPRVRFRDIVRIMVDADLAAEDVTPPGEGFRIVQECFPPWHRLDTVPGVR